MDISYVDNYRLTYYFYSANILILYHKLYIS